MGTRAKWSFVSASLLLAGCSFVGDSSRTKETSVRPFDGELGMQPGVGFESVLEDVRGNCIDYDGIDTSAGGQQAFYDVRLVENHRELGTELNVSSAQQVKAAIPDTNVNVSAKTKFMLGHAYAMNRYSVYLLAKAEIRNETAHLKNVRIKPEIQAELQNIQDPEVIDRLRLRCGDAFLSSFTTGGEFFGVIEIETESEEEQIQIKNEFEQGAAMVGIGDAASSQNFETKVRSATKDRNVKIWTYQRGGQGAAQVGLVDTVDAMMARVRDLPTYVTSQSGTAANYTATFKDYFTLNLQLPTTYRTQLFNAQDIIEELAGIQAGLIERRGDVQYILAHPNSFEGMNAQTVTALNAYVSNINDFMRRIYKGARACHRDFRGCQLPAEIASIPSIDLPKRKNSLQNLTRDVIAIKTTLEQIDVDELDGILNAPDCYLEIRIVAPNGSFRRIRRTPTDFTNPRCDELTKEFVLPLALVDASFDALGIDPNLGQIEVLVRDDDPGENDAVIGRLSRGYQDIRTQHAIIDTLTGAYVTMAVGFEVR